MSVFKCKMCGGDLTVTQEMTVCECQYCGSKQTLPRISDEKKNNLYDRAGHFRRNNEYDKAMAIYEQILNEDTEDAESYWSIVLCKYGIEYVEDPATHRRVPTVNRAQLTSVFMDENYKSALKYADSEQRAVYEAEAREIEQIQKGILEISSKEEPFDVFICYKESDAAGRRTPDSVLANDLYHQLTQEGFKVFFARITLEDKLGSAYEPYIFAALNSAKVMVVLGTRPEYFSAVWVKNEWSRFLTQIKSGAKKALIPAYKDMDPYDLPEEFSHLQAQDMSKLGFMQDLIRGIKKLVGTEEKTTENKSVVMESVPASSGAQALVERAFLFLEDGEFTRADELCEQALNQDPKNAKAYVGKLMVERQLRKQDELSEEIEELTENNYFQKALRFAEEGLKKELERCNEMIMDNQKGITYNEAMELVREGGVQGGIKAAIASLDAAISKYESLLGWGDSAEQIAACNEKKKSYFEQMYQDAKKLIAQFDSSANPSIKVLNKAIENLEYLGGHGGYLDSGELLREYDKKKRKYQDKLRKEANKKIRRVVMIASLIIVIIIGTMTFIKVVRNKIDEIRYDSAVAAMQEGEYDKVIEKLEKINSETYKSRLDNDLSKVYNEALEKYEAGDYDDAKQVFEELGEYKESEIYLNYALAKKFLEQGNYAEAEEYINILAELGRNTSELTYQKALAYMENGEYDKAIEAFSTILDYSDARDKIEDAKYQKALAYMENEEYDKAIEAFLTIFDYEDAKDKIKDARAKIKDAEKQKKNQDVYQEALAYMEKGEYDKAIEAFSTILDYKDAKDKWEEAKDKREEAKEANNLKIYQEAMSYMEKGEYDQAIRKFNTLPNDYKDVKAKKNECEKLKEEVEEAEKEANMLKIYQEAMSYMESGKYDKAIDTFSTILGYKDVKDKIEEAEKGKIYQNALNYMENGEYDKAIEEFLTISDYKDAKDKAEECQNHILAEIYQKALLYKEGGQYDEAIEEFKGLVDVSYRDAVTQIDECRTALITELRQKRSEVEKYSGMIYTSEITTVGLKSDGRVVATGANLDGQCDVGNWTDIVAVAAGNYHTVGLKSDGTVVAKGNSSWGQCYVSGWTDIVAVAAGYLHTVGLKSDGTVVATGKNEYGECNVKNWTDIVAVVAGDFHTVGLKSDGTVVATGANLDGQCDVGDWTDIVAVATTAFRTVGLKADGTAVVKGDSGVDEIISGWRSIVAITGDLHTVVGLKADGTVVTAGTDWDYGQNNVDSWTDIVAVVHGNYHTVGLKSDGTVVATGKNTYGECDVSNWNLGIQK